MLLLLLLLSRFSRVRLCATPGTAAHQAPLSLGLSRQEHCSGLPFPSPRKGIRTPWVYTADWSPAQRQPTITKQKSHSKPWGRGNFGCLKSSHLLDPSVQFSIIKNHKPHKEAGKYGPVKGRKNEQKPSSRKTKRQITRQDFKKLSKRYSKDQRKMWKTIKMNNVRTEHKRQWGDRKHERERRAQSWEGGSWNGKATREPLKAQASRRISGLGHRTMETIESEEQKEK